MFQCIPMHFLQNTCEQIVMIASDGGDKHTRQSKSSPACKTESSFFSKLGSHEASSIFKDDNNNSTLEGHEDASSQIWHSHRII